MGSDSENEGTSSQRRTRQQRAPRVKWTDEMDMQLLDYVKSSVQDGKGFEKPSAPDFYKRFLQTYPDFPKMDIAKIVQRMRNMKRNYANALEWRNKTGQGILESDPISGVLTVQATLKKRCKYFDDLDEILGDKPQFNPPYLHHSDKDLDHSATDEDIAVHLEEGVHYSVDTSDHTTGENQSMHASPLTDATLSPPKKKSKRSPVKNAAAALENSMKIRAECEEKRLQWEKESTEKKEQDEMVRHQDEIRLKERELQFAEMKWENEFQQRRAYEDKTLELERFRIEKDAELQKLRMEKEFELQRLKLTLGNATKTGE